MENKAKPSVKIFFFGLSLVFACFLWYFNTGEANDFVMRNFNNIPVNLKNANVLNERGLTLASDESYFVNLQFRGTNNNLNDINENSLKAEVDLSQIESAGNQNVNVTVTGFEQNVILEQILPSALQLNIVSFSSMEIDPKIIVQGKPAENYAVISASSSERVTLDGPQSQLDRVSEVSGIVSVNGMTEDSTDYTEIHAYDSDGVLLDEVDCSPEAVPVSVVLGVTKEVSITPPKTKGETDSKYRISKISTEPDKVTIAGKPEELEKINSVSVDTVEIDSSHRDSSFEVESNLILPKGISTIGDVKSVTVTVNIEEIIDKSYSVTDLKTNNLAPNLKVDSINPGSVTINVQGISSELEQNDASKLNGSLDLSQLGVGTYEVPVKVDVTAGKITSINPSEVKVVITEN